MTILLKHQNYLLPFFIALRCCELASLSQEGSYKNRTILDLDLSLCTVYRARHRMPVFVSSFDRLIGLSTRAVICRRNLSVCTDSATLKYKLLMINTTAKKSQNVIYTLSTILQLNLTLHKQFTETTIFVRTVVKSGEDKLFISTLPICSRRKRHNADIWVCVFGANFNEVTKVFFPCKSEAAWRGNLNTAWKT